MSEETYINKVLERFRMKDCSPSVAPIVKGEFPSSLEVGTGVSPTVVTAVLIGCLDY